MEGKTYKLELAKHKHDALTKMGFELDYDGGIHTSLMGKVKVRMLIYKHSDESMYEDIHTLYINFSDDEPAYCNLYYGTISDEAEVFSERNMISELKKRGFEINA